jgi:hypothetical protein
MQFNFVFLFNHSQGHVKKLANGLDAYSMTIGYGGAQPRMRESKINEHSADLACINVPYLMVTPNHFYFKLATLVPSD